MRVTKQKTGYRINLSDADYGMLCWLVMDGVGTYEGDEHAQAHWDTAEKAALTRRVRRKGIHGIMAVDENRR